MSVMGGDGRILLPGGGWWSPFGDTEAEIAANMRTGHMPNAPDVIRIGLPVRAGGALPRPVAEAPALHDVLDTIMDRLMGADDE